MNPFDLARGSRGMTWRKPCQGFDVGFNGSQQATGGNVADFMVAIEYGKGVIAAEKYHGKIIVKKFFSFAGKHFASIFKKC